LKKFEVMLTLIAILFRVILRNNNEIDEKMYELLKYEFKKINEHNDLLLSLKRVFPSGGTKVMKNYTRYKDSSNFRTRMKYISLFKNDLYELESKGVLRKYMDSMGVLDEKIEKEISERVEYLTSKKSGNQLLKDQKLDVESISNQNLKELYETAKENA